MWQEKEKKKNWKEINNKKYSILQKYNMFLLRDNVCGFWKKSIGAIYNNQEDLAWYCLNTK